MKHDLSGWRLWLPFYLMLAVAAGFVDLRVRAHPEHAAMVYVPEVVSGTAEAPALYRVLAPFTYEWVVRLTGADRMVAWHGVRLAWFLLAWLAWHVYLRTWFSVGASMLGTGLVAAALPLTYTNSWPHPDSIPELALFAMACTAIARHRDLPFAILLVFAALNRETAVFLVLLYVVSAPMTRPRLARAAGFGGLWLAVFGGLRLLRGVRFYDANQFWRNVDFLKLLPPPYDPYYRAYAWFGLVLFGPLIYLALASRSAQPMFVRRAVWVVPIVFGVAMTLSSIIETRIVTPCFSLVIPGVLFTLLGPEAPSDAVSA